MYIKVVLRHGVHNLPHKINYYQPLAIFGCVLLSTIYFITYIRQIRDQQVVARIEMVTGSPRLIPNADFTARLFLLTPPFAIYKPPFYRSHPQDHKLDGRNEVSESATR